jgi:hypothetical protein
LTVDGHWRCPRLVHLPSCFIHACFLHC